MLIFGFRCQKCLACIVKIENTPASILIELVIVKNKEGSSPRDYEIEEKWNKSAI